MLSIFFKKNKKSVITAFFILIMGGILLSIPYKAGAITPIPRTEPNFLCKDLGVGVLCYLKDRTPGKCDSYNLAAGWTCIEDVGSPNYIVTCVTESEIGKVCGVGKKCEKINNLFVCASQTELPGVLGGAAITTKAVGSFIMEIAYEPILKALTTVIYYIHWLFSWLLWLGAQLLGFVLNYSELQKFTSAPIVVKGWGICRDLANMFFALVLLIISFATILRVESYGIKQILPKLIIAALLINFSLVIAGVIIDFSQVLTKYFISAMEADGQDVRQVLMSGLKINQTFKPPSSISKPNFGDGFEALFNLSIALFGGLVLIVVAAFTFFAAAILLITRFVALWFLLILAPLAWLFYILPATSAYWSMWWKSFLKWVFFAPAYTFFLFLAIMIIKSGEIAKQAGFSEVQLAGLQGANFGATTLATIVDFIILIGFLLGGLITAQKLSVWGAGGLYGFAKSMGKGFGRMTGQWAGRGAPMPKVIAPTLRGLSKIPGFKGLGKVAAGYEAKTKRFFEVAGAPKRALAPLFVPDVWRRAMAGRRARSEAASFAQSSGRLEDYLSLRFKKSARITEQQRRAGEVSKKQDEFSKLYKTEEQVNHAYQTAKDPIEKEALLRLSTSINAINTLFASLGKNFDPDEFREYIRTTYGEDEGARIGADLSAVAASNGNYSLVGMSKWDPTKNKMVFASPAEQREAALNKSLEMESQLWTRQVHPDSFFERTGKEIKDPITGKIKVKLGGYTSKLHDFGKSFVQNINGGHIKHVDRLQGRTLKALYDNIKEVRDQAVGLGTVQKKLVNDFADAIENRYKNIQPKEEKKEGTKSSLKPEEFIT